MGVTVSLDCPREDCPSWVMVSFEDDDEQEPPAVYGKQARPRECAAGHRMTDEEVATLILRARRVAPSWDDDPEATA